MWCKILENVKLLALFSIKVCYANKMREKKLQSIWRVESEKTEIVQLFTCARLSTDILSNSLG